eukprot:gene8759-9695_t
MKSIIKARKDRYCKDKSLERERTGICNLPYKSIFSTWNGPWSVDRTKRPTCNTTTNMPSIISFSPECSKLMLIDFAVNGRYLACINIKNSIDYQRPLASSRNLSPTSQLVILEAKNYCGEEIICTTAPTDNDQENSKDNDLTVVASINLDLIDVYCVEMTDDTTQFAVYGFGYNTVPRKPTISIYQIHIDMNNSVNLSRKTKMIFENSEILSSKLTACKFFPTDSNILVTSMCEDYHSITRTNYLDFWNSKSSLHFARFNLLEKAAKFQGYVTSMSFSSDGLLLALTSSSKHCQLVIYSTQTCQFGPVFTQQDNTYLEQDRHFPVYSAFASNLKEYDLLVCTYHGEFLRLRLDPQQLTVSYVVSNTTLFDQRLQIDIPRVSFSVLEFKYCKATSRYVIRSQKGLAFVDANSNFVEKVILFKNKEHAHITNTSCCMALSRTGQELAVISNNIVQVHAHQNPDYCLKNCCREALIQLVPEDKISQLPLPRILKSYLLYNN